MMHTLARPVVAAWRALVAWHREHLGDDPDVVRLREQRQRIDILYSDLNRAAFGRDPWPRERGARHDDR